MIQRRNFLGGLCGLTGTLILESSCARVRSPGNSNPRRIDVHQHIWPPKYVALAKESNITILPANGWTIGKALEDMDRSGTATALTSITAPGLWLGNKEVSRQAARECNEYAAQMMRDHVETQRKRAKA